MEFDEYVETLVGLDEKAFLVEHVEQVMPKELRKIEDPIRKHGQSTRL